MPAGLRVLCDTGIVTRGDVRRSDPLRHLPELVELDEVVAERAGDRRAAGQVLAHKRGDHLLLEALLEIDDVVGNAEALGYVARIVDIVDGAASSAAIVSELR